MASETFEGAEINGKQFPFVRITVSQQKSIINRFKPTVLGILFEKYFPQTINQRAWKRTRSIAFEKDWKWKYFGIIPKELRCSHMGLKQAGEIQADFFSRLWATVQGHDAPWLSAIASRMGIEQTKQGA